MSLQGELSITLTASDQIIGCEITSSRPTQASRLFSSKSIEETLTTLPLLFNICSKAQSLSAVRAIESVLATQPSQCIESQRNALVLLENLREHIYRIIMDWPQYIGETPDNQAFSAIAKHINQLMLSLEPKQLLTNKPQSINLSNTQKHLWNDLSQQLGQFLFATDAENWLHTPSQSLDEWAEQQKTQAARFISWLNKQAWKNTGESSIPPMRSMDDHQLIERLEKDQEHFISQPDWQSNCYELSWFSRQQRNAITAHTKYLSGNSLFDRMLARLIEITDLMQKLQGFFLTGAILNTEASELKGLAHTEAARGRLTHFVKLEGNTIRQLQILAPTEWNFHPRGVVVDSLSHLQAHDETTLRQQADLIIHAIDPCVGYQLHIQQEEKR